MVRLSIVFMSIEELCAETGQKWSVFERLGNFKQFPEVNCVNCTKVLVII